MDPRSIRAALKEVQMPHPLFLTASLMAALISLPACSTAAGAVAGTVGATSRAAIGTAGAAGKVAVKTAGATQSVAAAAATGAVSGASREGGKLAVRGVAAAGQAGFRAMRADDSSISEETLAHRAGLTLGYPREGLTIGNVYEEGARTDFTALSEEGEAANCYVMQDQNSVTSATCQPAL